MTGFWRRRVGIVLGGVLMAATPAVAQVAEGTGVGDLAPVFAVNDLEGQPVDLGQYRGVRPVLLQFWATWCERCEALMPHMRDMAGQYGDEVAFVGINIAVNQSKNRVRRYVAEHQPPFRVLYDDRGTSVRALNVPTTSYIVILDREGIIRYVGVGADQQLGEVLGQVVSPGEGAG